jgi:hypothetical protein
VSERVTDMWSAVLVARRYPREVARPAALALMLLAAAPARVAVANDGAAEVAVGGIQLRNERRVAMRKERLVVALKKVEVEYEFVNESPGDVTTEIAFPIPDYAFSYDGGWRASFDEFRAWVDGREIGVATEVRAFVGKVEVTARLRALGIDAKTLGHLTWGAACGDEQRECSTDFDRLPQPTRAALRSEGIFRTEAYDVPAWTVRIVKHWTQRFPAGRVVKIRHVYAPAVGESNAVLGLDESCAAPAQRKAMLAGSARFSSHWVKYILTTANTWKTPIREFELLVDAGSADAMAFCWDGAVERLGVGRLRAARRDFVPGRELTVYFWEKKGSSGATPR